MLSRLRIAFILAAVALLAAPPAGAQGLYGQNKVQYEKLDWRVLRTPHVEVYFYAEEELLARELAAIAESTCVELDSTFRMTPRNLIPILTYSSHQAFQSSNATPGFIGEGTGGLTELIKGRVLIPHTGSRHRLVWVTRHELVHAYMLEKLAQVRKAAGNKRGAWPPLWFTEGLAEFVSTTWDATAEGLLQDAVVTGTARPMTKSWDIEGTVLMYKQGQSFLEFVAARHGGKRRVLDLFEHWMEGGTFEEIWEKTFDEKLETVDEEWFTSIRRRYYPRVATRSAVRDVARPVTCCGPTFDLAPVVLPPTSKADSVLRFAYLRAEDGAVDLRIRREVRGRVLSDRRILRGGFSPRFESFHVFRTRMGASGDGRLAVVAQQGGRDVLHVVDPRNGRVERTWRFPGVVGLSSPTWVMGDTAIVIVGQAVSGNTDLYRIRVADGALAMLTDDSADDDDPTAHPTEHAIVWSSDRESGGRAAHALYRMDLGTGAVTKLTTGEDDDRRATWSPDGRTLAFLSDRAGIDDLWLWRDGRVQRATRFLGPVYDPTWRPDGNALLFAGQAGWSFHVYEIPVTPVDTLWLDEAARPAVAAAPPPLAPAPPGPLTAFGPEPYPDFLPTPVPPPALAAAWPARAAEEAEPYRRRLSLDVAQSVVSIDPALGSGGSGGMVGLTDVLGNEGLYLFLANDAASLSDFFAGMEFSATYFNRSQRMNYGLGVFRLTRLYDADFDLFRREVRIGGSVLASYPLSRFTRVEASTVLRHAQDHLLSNGDFVDLWMLSNYFAIVHDDARFTFEGPADGHRLNLTAGYTRDLSAGAGDGVSLAFDGRFYRSPLDNVVWATRLVSQLSTGDDPERFYYGGPYALRGWERRVIFGTRTALFQSELRFPILGRARLGAPLPLEFPRVNVALFADGAFAGGSPQSVPQIGSLGAGVYVGGGWFPILRVDWVKRHDFRTVARRTDVEFTIGYLF